MNIIIRPYQMTDQAAVVKIWDQCGLIVPWNDPIKDIQRKMKVDPNLFLVATNHTGIVGTIMGGYEGHRGWINYLAVSPDAQGQNIGQRMIEIIEKKLLDMQCPKVNLQIRSTNKRMLEYYQKLGYEEDHSISMGKRLIPD